MSSPKALVTEKEVRDALEKYRTALTQHDAAALKQIWEDNYTFINGAGENLTKDQRLANLASGATALDTITMGDDTQVRITETTQPFRPAG